MPPVPIEWEPGTPEHVRRPVEPLETATPQPAEAMPPLDRLTIRQMQGVHCALCGGEMRGGATRSLGVQRDSFGHPFELWACAPRCSAPSRPSAAVVPAAGGQAAPPSRPR